MNPKAPDLHRRIGEKDGGVEKKQKERGRGKEEEKGGAGEGKKERDPYGLCPYPSRPSSPQFSDPESRRNKQLK